MVWLQTLAVIGLPLAIRLVRSPPKSFRLDASRTAYTYCAALLVYCLLIGYALRPVSLFQSLGVPLTAPYSVLLARSSESSLYSTDLLERLRTLDQRQHYLRFGASAILNCQICVSQADYLVFTTPRLLGTYAAHAALLGLFQFGSAAGGRGRRWVVLGLAASFAAEITAVFYDWPEIATNVSRSYV